MMFDSQNYERLFPREQRLFSRPFWPYSLHTFSLVSLVKKYATCKAKIALKKAFVHLETDIHSFSCPIINAFYNECGKDTVLQFHYKNFLISSATCCMPKKRLNFKSRPYDIFKNSPFQNYHNRWI